MRFSTLAFLTSATQLVKRLKLAADIVIVSFHGSAEGIRGLTLDPNHRVSSKIRALTHLDFPTHNLKFSGAGRIELKD